ncbi:MAG: phosphoenolpyruvate--protein phosphotransferase [Treponema sp.]|jgi:phosphotransferase system enzyme I (PtsI)|nr:phosphoenolpyruvate--protein phosphotransferase [Treponema sp.]
MVVFAMEKFIGIPASLGFISGKALLYFENTFPEIPRVDVLPEQAPDEVRRLDDAIRNAGAELAVIHERALQETSKEQADIFNAHLLMLNDPVFRDQLLDRFRESLVNIEWVVWDVAREMMQKMMSSPDPLFRERAADINDVSKRVLQQLLSIKRSSLAELEEDVIVVAHDLLPSEILTMDRKRVKGIVMDAGSRTSHTAILARAFNIPAVVGLVLGTKVIKEGDTLIVNGHTGEVLVNPGKKDLAGFKKTATIYYKQMEGFLSLRELPAETLDGGRVMMNANIEIPEEAEGVLQYGAEGIGLYRSEFLFLTPGRAAEEEQQYHSYTQVLQAMGVRPVTIRTMDIGGDKILPDFQSGDEKNPLLGWRAIRFSLALPELFKTQLRAILRASVSGNVKIMFPLVSGIEEIDQALALLDEARDECRTAGQSFAERIDVGIMIEVPSAAITADILAEKVDFFSVGTNDLIQYSLAVDRGNERISYLAQPAHPAVLRLLKHTIDSAHQRGIKAAMCGEMAGNPKSTALLLGLGLDEFSMAAQSIPVIKRIIRSVNMVDCRNLVDEVLRGISWEQNTSMVDEWMMEHCPGELTTL